MTDRLNDDSRWPLSGKYHNQRCGDIPDSYFVWLSKQEWIHKFPAIVEYLRCVDGADV